MTLRDPSVGLFATDSIGSTPGVKETLRDPSVGLFIMAGLRNPPSAVLGRDGAVSSMKNEVVDMRTMAHDKEFEVARRNVYAQIMIDNLVENLPSALCCPQLQVWTSTARASDVRGGPCWAGQRNFPWL